jgi:signal transduction histidine kinase
MSPADSGSGEDARLPRLPEGARTVLESAPDPLVVTDRQGRIVFLNAQAERLFGYDGAELAGAPLEQVVPTVMGVRRDGSEFPAEISLSSLDTDDGPLLLTAIHEVPAPIEPKVSSPSVSDEALRLRDEFLSIAAHELRTPLTALQLQVDGLDQLLGSLESPAPDGFDRVQARVEKAARNVARLTDLVNTLLDLSRIMGGRLDLNREQTDMAALVRQVAEDFSEGERAGSLLAIEAPEPIPVHCDRYRLEQILTNMLSNAIKYGKGRPIEVRVVAQGDSVDVEVRDHGIGVAPEDRQSIFEKFERAPAARNYGGMGLGLYISRCLAEAHGGSIFVATTDGEGATFVLRIPRLAAGVG